MKFLRAIILAIGLAQFFPLFSYSTQAQNPIGGQHSNEANFAANDSGDSEVWSMAGANSQRTSWVPEEVNPANSDSFGVEWYRPIEAYIGQHVQLVTARNKVYVSTARGVYALDTATGNEVWRFDTELPMGHSPTVVGNVLYVGNFDKRVYALEADTGSLIWTFEGAKGGFSTNPVVEEGKVMLGSRDGYFYALDQNNGALLWQYPPAGSDPLGPILYSAAYKDGKVFFAANDNFAYALDAGTGALVWESEKMPGDGYQVWWPVVYGDYVIFSGAPGYASDPGSGSIRDVVDQDDPYYEQMDKFQYGMSLLKTIQRDDVFYQGATRGDKLGPEFEAGSSADSTGISWSWENGRLVVDASKVTEYLEDDGQSRVNRSTNKPWRRYMVILNSANGNEYTFDSDQDGNSEYAPFLLNGTQSANQYPPMIIPTQDATGTVQNVIYGQNFYTYAPDWGISKAIVSGWQFGTQYISPIGDKNAVDEPIANSASGSILYTNLCCDRTGSWFNMSTGEEGKFWNYHKTLESIKINWNSIKDYQASLAPGYDQMWWGASMWEGLPRLYGAYGGHNGIYHNHGVQNPIVPYNGQLFVHRSNAVIALGPNATSLRQRTQNETPEQYETNIRQEYPVVSKPLLPINEPNYNREPVLTLLDIQTKLDHEITKLLQTGHLQPGYYRGTTAYSGLKNYFENPGDTLYILTQAYPVVSSPLKLELEKYIKQHFKMHFENDMYARTGYWIDNPPAYDLENVDSTGQLQPRTAMPYPAEVAEDLTRHFASTEVGSNWAWDYPQHNIYAIWLYAKTFYLNDQTKLDRLYNLSKDKLETDLPGDTVLHDEPWIHNGYIAGYIGFLNLQDLVGKSQTDASLRASVQGNLEYLLNLRASDFRKDHPWVGEKIEGGGGKIYRRSFNIARNFMNMTPELGDYLYDNAFNTVKTAVDEYNFVAPYWVATRYEATQGEFSSDNLYTHHSMFQAKAYIVQEPVDQLLKYLDSPAFAAGDLFYIQNLAAILRRSSPGFRLITPPSPQFVNVGDATQIALQIEPFNSFAETIFIGVTSSSPTLHVGVAPQQITPPFSVQENVILTIIDTNPSGSPTANQVHTVTITATSNSSVETKSITVLVGSQSVYLPIVKK